MKKEATKQDVVETLKLISLVPMKPSEIGHIPDMIADRLLKDFEIFWRKK